MASAFSALLQCLTRISLTALLAYYAGMSNFADDVRAWRQLMGMSQPEAAEAMHIPLGTLRGWEQERRQPDYPWLIKVALHAIAKDATGHATLPAAVRAFLLAWDRSGGDDMVEDAARVGEAIARLRDLVAPGWRPEDTTVDLIERTRPAGIPDIRGNEYPDKRGER
jgi:DNA-binding transcriptional regulator YiaG